MWTTAPDAGVTASGLSEAKCKKGGVETAALAISMKAMIATSWVVASHAVSRPVKPESGKVVVHSDMPVAEVSARERAGASVGR